MHDHNNHRQRQSKRGEAEMPINEELLGVIWPVVPPSVLGLFCMFGTAGWRSSSAPTRAVFVALTALMAMGQW